MTVNIDALGNIGTGIYPSIAALPPVRVGSIIIVDSNDATAGVYIGQRLSGVATWVQQASANAPPTGVVKLSPSGQTDNIIQKNNDPNGQTLLIHAGNAPALVLEADGGQALTVRQRQNAGGLEEFRSIRYVDDQNTGFFHVYPNSLPDQVVINGYGQPVAALADNTGIQVANADQLGGLIRRVPGGGSDDQLWACLNDSSGVAQWRTVYPQSATMLTPPVLANQLTQCDFSDGIADYCMAQWKTYATTAQNNASSATPSPIGALLLQIATAIPAIAFLADIASDVSFVGSNPTLLAPDIGTSAAHLIRNCLYCAITGAGAGLQYNAAIQAQFTGNIVRYMGGVDGLLGEYISSLINSFDPNALNFVGSTTKPGYGACSTYTCPPGSPGSFNQCHVWDEALNPSGVWHAYNGVIPDIFGGSRVSPATYVSGGSAGWQAIACESPGPGCLGMIEMYVPGGFDFVASQVIGTTNVNSAVYINTPSQCAYAILFLDANRQVLGWSQQVNSPAGWVNIPPALTGAPIYNEVSGVFYVLIGAWQYTGDPNFFPSIGQVRLLAKNGTPDNLIGGSGC